MKAINKIVILSDEYTTKIGKQFAKQLQCQFMQRKMEVSYLAVNTTDKLADAIYQFDRIGLELKPDLLIVLDLACVKMQSPEEEPLYNNMTIPLVHVLFRRPWEYEVFMTWRTNFIDRFYVLMPQDIAHVKRYYPRILNVRSLSKEIFSEDVRTVWAMEYEEDAIRKELSALPDYMNVIADKWKAIKNENLQLSEEEALHMCLQGIGFTCNDLEYLNILYLMKSVFILYNIEICKSMEEKNITMQESGIEEQVNDFLKTEFPVSLL